MVVGPEYNAIMGVALGIDKGARQPVLRGILALLAGFSAAMVVTLLFALAIRWSGHTAGLRPVSALIDNPNLFSVVVAVLAGIVGVVSLTEARASAPRTGRAIPERAGRRLATSCQVTAWTLAQSAAMSITVHWWSAAAARI